MIVGDPLLTPPDDQVVTITNMGLIGHGAEADIGNLVEVALTARLAESEVIFDQQASYKFMVGNGEVVRGLEVGVLGMKVGGSRYLYIPNKVGYGHKGLPGLVPPDADLKIDVKLLSVKVEEEVEVEVEVEVEAEKAEEEEEEEDEDEDDAMGQFKPGK